MNGVLSRLDETLVRSGCGAPVDLRARFEQQRPIRPWGLNYSLLHDLRRIVSGFGPQIATKRAPRSELERSNPQGRRDRAGGWGCSASVSQRVSQSANADRVGEGLSQGGPTP